ncbi:hypothetical protein CCUS01_16133 [Colletotrichum cuscutae]|uniref:Uncharacterized protein n=1 Tax=Colletotrichum cuscutae TaxID=1209917 RepID=A0AAI9VD81_9PEZI|nr:hypothetical protein CCUS01_16133 [Colletotrichum cuscutae]
MDTPTHPVLCFTVLASAMALIIWVSKPALTWLTRETRLEKTNNVREHEDLPRILVCFYRPIPLRSCRFENIY